MFRSTNKGGTWEAVNSGISYSGITDLALSPSYASDQTVFALTPYQVFRSTDGGATWSEIPVPSFGFSNVPGFNALVLSPAFTLDRTLFVGEGGPADAPARGVLRSTDGGNSWQVMNHGLTATIVRKLAISPAFDTDKTLFAITPGEVFRSKDSGANWEPVKSDIVSVFFSPNYTSDRTILAGVNLAPGRRVVDDGGGIYRSVDRGDSWELVTSGLPIGRVFELVLSPTYALDHTLFQHSNGDIFRSIDGGVTWAQLRDNLTRTSILKLVLSPAYNTDHTILAGTYGGGVFRSTAAPQVSPARALAPLGTNLVRVWGYDAVTQKSQLHDPAAALLSDLTALTRGQGYWINVKSAQTVTLGTSEYNLVAGWNLIGWLG